MSDTGYPAQPPPALPTESKAESYQPGPVATPAPYQPQPDAPPAATPAPYEPQQPEAPPATAAPARPPPPPSVGYEVHNEVDTQPPPHAPPPPAPVVPTVEEPPYNVRPSPPAQSSSYGQSVQPSDVINVSLSNPCVPTTLICYPGRRARRAEPWRGRDQATTLTRWRVLGTDRF